MPCLLAVSLGLLAGCPSKPGGGPTTVTKPFRGQQVELIVPAALRLPVVWDVALQEWMDQTGASVQWTEYSDAASLSEKLSATPSSDRVILFPLPRLTELDRHLSPLPTGSQLDPKDIFKGLRDRVVSRNRVPVAIPISAPVLLCYYRADLLKAKGLNPPETWEEYQSLVESLEDWAPGLTAVEPLSPAHRSTLFFARSLAYAKHPENYSVWFDIDSGKPLLDGQGFQEAIQFSSRSWKRMPTAIDEMSPADCRRQVLDGKAALAIGMEPETSQDSASRATPFEVGICRLPGSRRVYNPNAKRWEATEQSTIHAPALCGFEGWGLSVGHPQPETKNVAASHLLASLAGSQFESHWAALPKTVCRESQVASASSWNESGLRLEEASQAIDAMAQSLRDSQVVSELPLANAEPFRQKTSDVLGRMLKGDVEPDAAIVEIQAAFQEIVDKAGADAIRSEYRRGLGLPVLESAPK
jgi:multiple sugar transport system substrate-binding protein